MMFSVFGKLWSIVKWEYKIGFKIMYNIHDRHMPLKCTKCKTCICVMYMCLVMGVPALPRLMCALYAARKSHTT